MELEVEGERKRRHSGQTRRGSARDGSDRGGRQEVGEGGASEVNSTQLFFRSLGPSRHPGSRPSSRAESVYGPDGQCIAQP